MSRRREIEAYSRGMDAGTELVLARLAAKAEEIGPLTAEGLNRMLAQLVRLRRERGQ